MLRTLSQIDPNKASRILTDPEVASAIAAKRAAAAAAGPDGDFILLQEAFTSHDELIEAHKNGVDAVILGEELLQGRNMGLTATIEKWKQH
jgi:hypothetical protein